MLSDYFSKNGEEITHPSQLEEGELYALTRHRGYRGFVMPGEDRISQNGHLRLVGVTVYETEEVDKKGKIRIMVLDLNPEDFEHPVSEVGVFRAKKDSHLRKVLLEKLRVNGSTSQ